VALPVAIVAAFSLLLQVAVPPRAYSLPPDALLALGSICHVATGDDGDRAPQPLPGHGDECYCPLCQVAPVAFLLPPPAPRLPVPSASVLRAVPLPTDGPRGAARPAYASRAPPTIG